LNCLYFFDSRHGLIGQLKKTWFELGLLIAITEPYHHASSSELLDRKQIQEIVVQLTLLQQSFLKLQVASSGPAYIPVHRIVLPFRNVTLARCTASEHRSSLFEGKTA